MDTPLAQSDETWTAEFPRALGKQRQAMRQFVASRRRQLDEIETRLAEQIASLASEAQQAIDSAAAAPAQQVNIELPTERLAQLRSELTELHARFEQAQQHVLAEQRGLSEQIERQQAELAARRDELEQTDGRLREQERQLNHSRQEAQDERQRLADERQRLAVEQQQLAHEQQRLADEQKRLAVEQQRLAGELTSLESQRRQWAEKADKTESQRRQIARELKTQRSALRREIEESRTERQTASARDRAELDAWRAEVRAQSDQLRQQQADFQKRRGELEAAETRLEQDQRRQAALGDEVALERNNLSVERGRLAEQLAKLAADREQLDQQTAETRGQRRRIGRELKAQRDAQRKDVERCRSELAELEAGLAAQQRRLAKSQQELETDRQAYQEQINGDTHRWQQEIAALRDKCARLESELTQAAGVSSESRQHDRRLDDANERIADLEQARKRLIEQLGQAEDLAAELKQRLNEQPTPAIQSADQPADPDAENRLRDLEQRYKMAIDDVRTEKARATELERKLAQSPARAATATAAAGGGLDWETQKRELLRRLADDFDQDDSEQAAQRLEIEEVIRATDRVVAEKERELSELRQLLEEQSNNWGSMAVGATAVAEILDKDEMVRQERESLQTLQTEWRDKLRQAEIDISLERAKIARDRAELDENLRALAAAQPKQQESPTSDHGKSDKTKKLGGSRWFKHLGLKGPDEE